MRPYLWESAVSIVPLRIGGGTRLKIYEAMAAKIPVVSTTIGAEGLDIRDGENIRDRRFARGFRRALPGIARRLRTPRRAWPRAAWEMVSACYSWEVVARKFEQLPAHDSVSSILPPQYHELKTEIDAAVARVFESGQFVGGHEIAALEEEFAGYCGAEHAVAVNSGTSALHLALLAAGIRPGDEVITVPFTFYATVAAIGYVGATPVYVDIDPATFNMDAAKIEAAITDRTRAILPVHLYGQCADMDPILDIARRHKLIVIEDAAQAHGAEYRGRRAGSIGDIGCFSFYPTKNLGAAGEGGMVTTNNPEFARTAALLRSWGEEQRYCPRAERVTTIACQSIQAAILRVKLRAPGAMDRSASPASGGIRSFARRLRRHASARPARLAARILSVHHSTRRIAMHCSRAWKRREFRRRFTIPCRFTLCLLTPTRDIKQAIFRSPRLARRQY